jgi:hypothetical protein
MGAVISEPTTTVLAFQILLGAADIKQFDSVVPLCPMKFSCPVIPSRNDRLHEADSPSQILIERASSMVRPEKELSVRFERPLESEVFGCRLVSSAAVTGQQQLVTYWILPHGAPNSRIRFDANAIIDG